MGQNVLATSSPFRWGNAPFRVDKILSKRMMGEAIEFGLVDGFCVPIYSATGWQSAFSFASNHRLDSGPKELAALTFWPSRLTAGSGCSWATSPGSGAS